MEEIKYYCVRAKCGHVGRSHYIPIDFPIKATSGKEAARICRYMPRVKHDHKDAILSCREIGIEEYNELIKNNSDDLYLRCKRRGIQNEMLDLSSRVVLENKKERTHSKEERKARVKYKLEKYREIELKIFYYDTKVCY